MKKPPALKVNAKCIMKNGKLSIQLNDDSQKHKDIIIEYCIEKHGGYVFFELASPKRPRKTGKGSQSAKFNGGVQIISMETGQPFDDIKKYIKSSSIDRGYPMLTECDGSPIVDLWGNKQGISEADCEVEECSILIEAMIQLAAELNIKLPEGE